MNPIKTAKKLKALRTFKGMTSAEVAEKAALNLEDYEILESGKAMVETDKLAKVCKALDVDMKDWFDNEDTNIFINSGKFKSNANSCGTCYFYLRSDEEMESLKTVSATLAVLVEKVQEIWLSRDLDKYTRHKNKEDDEG